MKDTHDDTVHGIRQRGTQNWAFEDDAGQMAFGPLCARTLFFDPDADEETISSHMSAAPGGHETVEQVAVRRQLEVLEDELVG